MRENRERSATVDVSRRLDEMLFDVPKATAASVLAMTVCAYAFWRYGPDVRLAWTAVASMMFNFVRVTVIVVFWIRRPSFVGALPTVYWKALFVSGALCSFSMAMLAILSFATRDPLAMALSAAALSGHVAGVIFRASVAPRVAIPHILLVFSPMIVVATLIHGGSSLAALLLLFCFACLDLSRSLYLRMRAQLTAESELLRMARTDYLTGLANRAAFDAQGEGRLLRASDRVHGLSLAMIDLDGFKGVNDTHGHDVGDEVLKMVGERLRCVLEGAHFAARLGGDEFAVVFDLNTTADRIRSIGDDIVAAVSRPFLINGVAIQISASIGIAGFEAMDEDFSSLVRRADRSMYLSKASGRNRICTAPGSAPGIVPEPSFAEQTAFR